METVGSGVKVTLWFFLSSQVHARPSRCIQGACMPFALHSGRILLTPLEKPLSSIIENQTTT